MSSPGYVFCKWKKHFWPAKVLSSHSPVSGNSKMSVEILCLDEQIHVKHKDTKPLEKTEVENIAAELATRTKSSDTPIWELTYRKALRIALDILNKNSSEDTGITNSKGLCDQRTNERFAPSTKAGESMATKEVKQRNTPRKSSSCTSRQTKVKEKNGTCDNSCNKQEKGLLTANSRTMSAGQNSVKIEPVPPTNYLHNKSAKVNKQIGRKRTRDSSSDSENEMSKNKEIVKGSKGQQKSSKGAATQKKTQEKNETSGPKTVKQEVQTSTNIRMSPESPKPTKREDVSPKSLCTENIKVQRSEKQQTCSKRKLSLTGDPKEHNESKALLSSNFQSDIPTDSQSDTGKLPDLSVENCSAVEEFSNSKKETILPPHKLSEDCAEKPQEERPLLHRARLPRPKKTRKAIKEATLLQHESSETDTERAVTHPISKFLHHPMPDFEEERGLASSELSIEISSPENHTLNPSMPEEDLEEDEDLPNVLLQQGPASIEPGMFVWCKFRKYPYWPSVVKTVRRKEKKATVLFVEESLSNSNQKKKGFSVSLRNLKPYDCTEKQQLLAKAKEDYGDSVDWCDAVISGYRICMGCRSFSGSFTEYCTADIISTEDSDSQSDVTPSKSKMNRKLLPDRQRAARDRANEKLVEFILKNKLAESHLKDILEGKKKSHWLKDFQASTHPMDCIETYLEDEDQMGLVVGYLQALCEQMSSTAEKLMNKSQLGFILEVLLPEAIIFAISEIDEVNYEKAEKKYREGPSISKRERSLFDEQILENKKLKELEKLAT
ncbi:PWWP domain-containing DNA repair factor 3A isoform X2 [Bombina bombina]|uniref:PWWP domain-containing DNA repair factor 3A isoform X2 n=1 Tax=Bombina bombina TaxID=8345 RepID=UPI00235A6AD2|nr:PWWP domain-containing DNA repair factor 3A isoform X2 [Bombina bombina]